MQSSQFDVFLDTLRVNLCPTRNWYKLFGISSSAFQSPTFSMINAHSVPELALSEGAEYSVVTHAGSMRMSGMNRPPAGDRGICSCQEQLSPAWSASKEQEPYLSGRGVIDGRQVDSGEVGDASAPSASHEKLLMHQIGFCAAGTCRQKACQAAARSCKQPLASSLAAESSRVVTEGQREEQSKVEVPWWQATEIELQSLDARQRQRARVLKAAVRRPMPEEVENGRPVRLKDALCTVAAARAQLSSSGLQMGSWKLPQGLAERRKNIRLAAKYLQSRQTPKSVQVSQPPPCSSAKSWRRSYSSDGSN